MSRNPSLFLLSLSLVASACLPPVPEVTPDVGVDAGSNLPDAGHAADAGRPSPVDAGAPEDTGPTCDQNTVIYGGDCPEEGCAYGDSCGETGCGTYLCSQEGDLSCFFDEANICGGCDELDDSAQLATELGRTK